VEDFYKMFAANEGLIASLAAERGTASQVLRLKEINDRIKQIIPTHSDSAETYRQLNVDFHKTIHSMANSPILSSRQIANFELSDFFIVQTCGFKAHLNAVSDEHDTIIAALESRDKERATQEAVSHIDSVARDVIGAMRDAEIDSTVSV
jgi:DNA-binding GntR family transcriptional regulator